MESSDLLSFALQEAGIDFENESKCNGYPASQEIFLPQSKPLQPTTRENLHVQDVIPSSENTSAMKFSNLQKLNKNIILIPSAKNATDNNVLQKTESNCTGNVLQNVEPQNVARGYVLQKVETAKFHTSYIPTKPSSHENVCSLQPTISIKKLDNSPFSYADKNINSKMISVNNMIFSNVSRLIQHNKARELEELIQSRTPTNNVYSELEINTNQKHVKLETSDASQKVNNTQYLQFGNISDKEMKPFGNLMPSIIRQNNVPDKDGEKVKFIPSKIYENNHSSNFKSVFKPQSSAQENTSVLQMPVISKIRGTSKHVESSTAYLEKPVNNMLHFNNSIKIDNEEVEEEEESISHAETYADYMPSKLKIGMRHPDPVIESSSLSSVQPPDVWYKLSIPEEVIDNGYLSALQLEAITYACQKHERILPDNTRAGFLIGDGAGVGKGRTLAGIIYENYLLGRKRAIWLSVSNDLKYDAERDLKDIGASNIKVHLLNKFKYDKISSKDNGGVKKGIIFSTYSSLIGESQSDGKYNTRLKQLLHWCGENFDGCIVFDECHKAKNLCPVGFSKPTKTGLTVLELQNKLPKARIVYASATGASEPKNMAYMVRLGLWGKGTPFKEFSDFISVVEKRGVGAMELVAMDMKLRGLYMARQLSFSGVSFKIEEIPLSEEFTKMYNEAVNLWVDARVKFAEAAELMEGDSRIKKTMWSQFWASHQRFFKYLCIASKVKYVVDVARETLKNGKCVVIGLQSTGEARTLEQLEESGGELTDFVSTAKGVFQVLVEKHFPAPDHKRTIKILGINNSETSSGSDLPFNASCESDSESRENETSGIESDTDSASGRDSNYNPFGNDSDSDDPWIYRKERKKRKIKKRKNKGIGVPAKKHHKEFSGATFSDNSYDKVLSMKSELLEKVDKLPLPPNTLDQLIDSLGGPENVAELTGRKGRIISSDGNIQYESRSEIDAPLEALNILEKQRFMDGEKNIAIISEAASSGISLQSDKRVKNQARRVHITLELPWSADKAIQQFGRTHRSNQVNAPEYLFLISDLAGERRFASTVAKRLESLGALTHGDRRATESRDLSQFNIDNSYGRTALDATMRTIMEYDIPLVPSPYKKFFCEVRKALIGVGVIAENQRTGHQNLEKDYNNMSKFMNRILGLPVELQNVLFKYFTDTLDALITKARKSGNYDLGILDLGKENDLVKILNCDTFMQKYATGVVKTELYTILVDRGLSWESALEKFQNCSSNEGFYISNRIRNNHKTAILALSNIGRSKSSKKSLFYIYRPNTGLQAKQESLDELKSKYIKSNLNEVEKYWKENYIASSVKCSHLFWNGRCQKKVKGDLCEVGLRQRQYCVLSGSVLSNWTKVESTLSTTQGGFRNPKLQVVRLKVGKSRIVGCLIPNNAVNALKKVLAEDANLET